MDIVFKNFVPEVYLMTRQILFLMTAMLVLGVSTTSIANAERWNIEVYGDELQNIVDVKQSDTLRFVGDPDGLKGFEIYDKSKAPNTSNCQSGYDAAEYSVCVMSFAEFTLGGHEWFDRTTDTWGKFYVHPAETTGNGTMEVHVYEIPFDVTILEGGKVVYHNLDPVTYHNLEHTGTTGTEKGGTFSMWAGSNGGTATANFPVENCSSCYPAGVYSWMDSVSGVTGTITILPNPNTVNEQVGIQENVVVVLNKPEPTIQTNSTVTTEQQDILDKTKSYKTQIEEKINAKIKPLETEIIDLKNQLIQSKNDVSILESKEQRLINDINVLKTNATISETKYLEESKINKELREKISTLESQVVDTTELEKYKKEASNWKAVALEQLRVMAEILGLF